MVTVPDYDQRPLAAPFAGHTPATFFWAAVIGVCDAVLMVAVVVGLRRAAGLVHGAGVEGVDATGPAVGGAVCHLLS